jgi:type I restriction enzyme S subunit
MPSLNNNTKRTLTPTLRFPEFRQGKGWKFRPLGQLLSRSPEYGINAAAVPFSETLPTYLRITDIDDDGRFISESKVSVDAEIDETNYLTDGDVVLARTGASVGKSYRYREEDGRLVFAGFLIRVKPDPKKCIPTLLANYLTTRPYWDWVGMTSARSGQPGINGSEYATLPIPLPLSETEDYGLAEQKKIADCLSSLDALVAAQGRKVEALKAHKKGLMQQLFPREGENLPRLRFPEFRDAGEWKETKLEEIGRVIRGSSPRPQGDARYYGGPVPRLMVQDVTRDGKWVTPCIDSLTEEGAQLSRPCPAETLTIVCSGTVGVVSFLAVDACIHDGFLALIDIDESVVTKDFLFHTLSTLREQFEKGATHGGIFTNLTTAGIKVFKVNSPNTAEQKRIAECLTSLDVQINTESEKLDALKTHKKGLVQQLFPSPEGNGA